MEVTFELTQEMIENELLCVYYNTFAFNSFGCYMKSPLGCNFIKHLSCDYEMRDYWIEKTSPLKIHSIDIFETPFGKISIHLLLLNESCIIKKSKFEKLVFNAPYLDSKLFFIITPM